MASYKILDVQEKYAVVEITFDRTQFDDYDANGNPILVSHQVYKFDDLTTDDSAVLTTELNTLVQAKLNEIEPAALPTDVTNMIGETLTV